MELAVVDAAPTAVAARAWRWPGRVSLAIAVSTPLLVIAGIVMTTLDEHLAAWSFGFGAIATSLLAVSGGIIAAAGGWGRAAGVTAIVVGVLANPLILVWGLDLLEGL